MPSLRKKSKIIGLLKKMIKAEIDKRGFTFLRILMLKSKTQTHRNMIKIIKFFSVKVSNSIRDNPGGKRIAAGSL